MKHLIIGATGLLGHHFYETLERKGHHVVGTYFTAPRPGMMALDLGNEQQVRALLTREQPDVVYLPAANPNVEWCEANPEIAYEINVRATIQALDAALAGGSRVVFFSSEYVFDGTAGPYNEDAESRPISVYGAHKLLVEQHLRAAAPEALILRTTVVYGLEKRQKNFLYGLRARLSAGEIMRVPQDQISTPTYAPSAAEIATRLVDIGASGIFNLVGSDVMSRYDFALQAAHTLGLDDKFLQPVATKDLGQLAPRPLQAGLTMEKAYAATGVAPMSVAEGLAAFRHALDSSD